MDGFIDQKIATLERYDESTASELELVRELAPLGKGTDRSSVGIGLELPPEDVAPVWHWSDVRVLDRCMVFCVAHGSLLRILLSQYFYEEDTRCNLIFTQSMMTYWILRHGG